MLVLGLDTSTPACGVVLCDVADSIRELARREVVDPRRHGELLAPLISEVLGAADVSKADLGAIVVGLGPGPYTSLRVGIVTAAALADALGIAAYGVCSLDGLVPAGSVGTVTAATDARRREVYWARYSGAERVAGPAVSLPADVVSALVEGERVIGAGGEVYASVFGSAFDTGALRYPDPLRLIQVGASQLGTVPQPLTPLYLRRPDAKPLAAA